jgi:hypothetical protein
MNCSRKRPPSATIFWRGLCRRWSTIVCGAVHAADGQPEHPDSFNTGASNAAERSRMRSDAELSQ